MVQGPVTGAKTMSPVPASTSTIADREITTGAKIRTPIYRSYGHQAYQLLAVQI